MAAREIRFADRKIKGKIHASNLVYHMLDINKQRCWRMSIGIGLAGDKCQCLKQNLLIWHKDLYSTNKDVVLYRFGKAVVSKFSYSEFWYIMVGQLWRSNQKLIKIRLEKAISKKKKSHCMNLLNV